MRFARTVFVGAGIWGIAVLTPLYWLIDITGRRYPLPADYPHFFYGFLSVALAWQLAFLIVGINPLFFRALMLPSILEKFGWVATLAVALRSVADSGDRRAGGNSGPGAWLLFVVAFVRTGAAAKRVTE
jgi:hypothetical protein